MLLFCELHPLCLPAQHFVLLRVLQRFLQFLHFLLQHFCKRHSPCQRLSVLRHSGMPVCRLPAFCLHLWVPLYYGMQVWLLHSCLLLCGLPLRLHLLGSLRPLCQQLHRLRHWL